MILACVGLRRLVLDATVALELFPPYFTRVIDAILLTFKLSR
jgi:hypothetical protein